MLRVARTNAAAFLGALIAAAGGLPPTDDAHSLAVRSIEAYDSMARGYLHAAAFSPDGRRVAALATLPPANFGRGPYPLTLQVWDAVALGMVASRDLGVVGGPARTWPPDEQDFSPYQCLLSYAPDGSFLVMADVNARFRTSAVFSLYDVTAHLRVISAGDLRDLRSIELDLPRYPPAYGPAQIQLSPAGDRLAVAISPLSVVSVVGLGANCQDFQGTELRVYDVKTGGLAWNAAFKNARSGGVAWSPDGLKLALTLPSTRGDKWFSTLCPQHNADNLLILESSSGRVLTSVNTGDLPGPVCFGPHGQVFTAPFHFYIRSSKGEQVKVWNAQTGALEHTIGLRGRDVHNMIALSRDGRLLVGYVGKEKSGFSLRVLEDVQEIVDQRIAVWDAGTGGLLGVSQDLIPMSGLWRGKELKLRMHLAADGRSLLANWDDAHAPLLLFDLPDTRIGPAR